MLFNSRIFKFKLVLVFLGYLLVVGPGISLANEDLQGPMPLDIILKDIIETNPEIIQAKENYESVVKELSIARSGFLPTIGAEASHGLEVTDGVGTDYDAKNYQATRVLGYARQNLFNGFETKAFVEETEARILAAAYDVINMVNEVYLDAAEAYINVLKTRELLKFSEQNVMTQEKVLKQVKETTDAGFTRVSDLTNSKARLSLAKGNYISAQQDLEHATIRFHRQFGRILLPEQFVMPEPEYQFPDTIEETTDLALRNHPALKVSKFNIHARKSGYERTKGAYWPSLDLEFQGKYDNDINGVNGESRQFSALLKLNYVFADGGIRDGEKGQKYHNLLKEYQRAYTERRNVNQAVRLAWNINEAEKIKREFLDEHLSLTEETLAAFKDEYHLGRRTLLDLLDMENEYHAAAIANTESKYNNLTAYYRIAQATGVLIHEFDSSLLKEMNLPTDKPYELKKYEKEILNPNRDADIVVDVIDQCDNSAKDCEVLPYGCIDNMVTPIGYTEPEQVDPYILPKEEPAEGLEGSPMSLDEDSDKLGASPLLLDDDQNIQTLSLNTIHFLFDSSQLTEETKQMLIPVADQLKTASQFKIEIVGHTDNIGDTEYNQMLSEARALSVLKELQNLGIDGQRMTSSGKGELEPIADNATEEGRAKNRRTELILIK